jgi:hypothetical protein
MSTVLSPASAAAFAPPNVVLGSEVGSWFTNILERVNQAKRPLNDVSQYTTYLTGILSSKEAIWRLCSVTFTKDENPFDYQMIHIDAYVVHIDMVSQNEVAFKLTSETIKSLESLVDFYREGKKEKENETQPKKPQKKFDEAAKEFIFRTDVNALDGLEESGAGELLAGRSEKARAAISDFFGPLLRAG